MFCISRCSYSANRRSEHFVHEIEVFSFMEHHLKAALGQSEVICFIVEAELQQGSDSRMPFKDMEYRWSTFSLWLR